MMIKAGYRRLMRFHLPTVQRERADKDVFPSLENAAMIMLLAEKKEEEERKSRGRFARTDLKLPSLNLFIGQTALTWLEFKNEYLERRMKRKLCVFTVIAKMAAYSLKIVAARHGYFAGLKLLNFLDRFGYLWHKAGVYG
ncbi:unnamed protein product [Vicia faba]|uniref:Uncharacterized protein n=1 Tax=Vicia faba TaxID=3906 RepID=A0AAV0Z9L1_VICFA|nr:unnamed protein product [Vicia faba]